MKRTLLVTLEFPPHVGGVATYYYQLCRHLPANDILVLAPSLPGAEQFDRQQNFRILRWPFLNRQPARWPKGLGALKLIGSARWMLLLRQLREVIQHQHIEHLLIGQVLPLGTIALLVNRRRAIPFTVITHGMDVLLPQHYLRKNRLLRRIITQADHLVANSYFTQRVLLDLGAERERTSVIHPCPDLNPTNEAQADELRHRLKLDDQRILLTVGRLVQRKGHDMVLRALPRLRRNFPNLRYLVVGSGPYRTQLELLARQMGVADMATFAGTVPGTELPGYYQLCELFVMPARELPRGDVEGFGTVYLEANLFGKPVVAGNSGGIPDAVQDGITGTLVNPLDLDELVSAISLYLADQAYAQRIGLQGMARVLQDFRWADQAKKFISLLS